MTDPRDPTIDTASGSVAERSDLDEAYCSACGKSFSPDHEWCPTDGARLICLKATKDLLIDRVFEGRYQIRSPLGEGGMGTVYRGLQLSVDREVAIKVIHSKLASDRVAVKRFLREARLSSRLNQPSIVNVYDFGQTDDGILYLVMELLKGRTLHSVIDSGTLDLERTRTILLQLCDALEAAHNQGIIHRDLKPGNIVILDEPPGRDLIKVLDFGLAKSLVTDTTSNITNTNAMMGTPLYMSPEQVEGRASDGRSDLYALGCIAFQMLSGRPPFQGDTINAVLFAHVKEQAPPLPARVPARMAAMIERMLAKRPEDRVGTAAEVREGFRNDEMPSGLTMPPRSHITAQAALAATVPPSVAERPRSSRRLALFLAAGVLAFGAVLVVTRLVRTGSPSATRDAVTADVPASRPQLDATEPFDAAVDVPADAAIAIDAGHRPDAGRPHVIDAGRPHVIDARPLVLNGGVDAAVPLVLPPKLPDAGVAPAPDAGFIEPGFHSTKARDAGP